MTRAAVDVAIDILTAHYQGIAGRLNEPAITRQEVVIGLRVAGHAGDGVRRSVEAIAKIIEEDRESLRAEILGQRLTGGNGGDRG